MSEACRPAISDGEALKSAADTWLVVRYGCGRERDGSGGSGKEGALSGSGTGMPGGAPAGRADWGGVGGSVVGVTVRSIVRIVEVWAEAKRGKQEGVEALGKVGGRGGRDVFGVGDEGEDFVGLVLPVG